MLWLICNIPSYAQNQKLPAGTPNSFDHVISKLQNVPVQEKIHIHFDKPAYQLGDTAWFKVYVVNAQGNLLSNLSKSAYVDIRMPNGEVKQLILPVIDGTASAQLEFLPGFYSPGAYQIKAYTPWMWNAGEEYFFSQTLQVGESPAPVNNASAKFSQTPQGILASVSFKGRNPWVGQPITYKMHQGEKVLFAGTIKTDSEGKMNFIVPNDKWPTGGNVFLETSTTLPSGANLENWFIADTSKNKLFLDFMPEGGNLFVELRSKVGFKAIELGGKSVDVKGYIEDNTGEKIALFESIRGGMGTFSFTPSPEKMYTAVIAEGKFKAQRFALPKALKDGVNLTVYSKNLDTLIVRIAKTAGNNISEIRLLVQSNGEVQKAVTLPFNTSIFSFALPVSGLSVGINQFTLFSPNNKPLAERLVFVHKDQQKFSKLEANKSDFLKRERVSYRFNVEDEKGEGLIGSYSVAVVKKDQLSVPEEDQLSIFANLLLKSDLRGKIENPNYYFIDYNEDKALELDALMLTQGWRRFNWNELLSSDKMQTKYAADKGLSISGQVFTPGNKPVPNANISLVETKQMLILDTVANNDGRFAFFNLPLRDSAEVMIRARGVKENKNVKIILDNQFRLPDVHFDNLGVLVPGNDTVAVSAGLAKTATNASNIKTIQGNTIREVEIAAIRKPVEIKGSVYPFAAPPADYTFEPDRLQDKVSVQSLLWGLPGVRVSGDIVFGRYRGKEGPMAILLNGIRIENLAGINPRSLTGVQIIKGGIIANNMATSLLTDTTSFGIIFLTAKGIDPKFIKAERPMGFLQHHMTAYTMEKEFYIPKYDEKKEYPAADMRTTLFWSPSIVTSEAGVALFDFYTSDEHGEYQVTLEGVGSNGQLTRKIEYFKVK